MSKPDVKKTVNYNLYLLDKEFKEGFDHGFGFDKRIKLYQDFYNGDQYPTENFKNMPRVVMNICSFATNIKASKVVGTPIFIQYVSDKEDVDCIKLQRFDEYNCSKLNEKTENFQSALNGFNNGTEFAMYRWDEFDTAYKGIYKGGLVLEHIDPRNLALANPYLSEIQNQAWVMYWSDEQVAAVKEMCEDEDLKDNIVPDDYEERKEYYSHNPSAMNHRLVRVYTRFFRINGEVFFMSSTADVDLFKFPHSLNPDTNNTIDKKWKKEWEKRQKLMDEGKDVEDKKDYRLNEFQIDYEDMMLPYLPKGKLTDKEYKKIKEQFSLFPISTFVPFAVNGSAYGRSDIKSMLATQKGINFMLSMMLMCAQNNAYNKIFAKEGALKGQEITNEPGQVVTDYSKMTNGWGIKMAESQPMPNGLIDFVEKFLGMARMIGGFNDVMDGSISNQDISGYAIQQMIKQANSSIEQQQQLFWKFCKDKAAIRLMFYKFYVDKASYTYDLEDFEVTEQEAARNKLARRKAQLNQKGEELAIGDVDLDTPTRKTKVESITKDEIYGANFDINIDVMQGLADSKLAEAQMWDTLIMNGGIQNLEPEMLELYLEANPMVTARTKQVLRSIVEKQKRSENTQLKQALQVSSMKLQQAAQLIKEMQAQLQQKDTYNKNLTKEFTDKINASNKMVQGQNQVIADLQAQVNALNGVTQGEVKSNNARGVSGSQVAVPSQAVTQ